MAASFLSNATSNRTVQLVTTAAVSGAVVAGAILSYQRFSQSSRISRLKDSIPPLDNDADHRSQELTPYGTVPPPSPDDARTELLARRAQAGDFAPEVILEQLARTAAFLQPEGLARLRAASVVVVGCGGVGSHCAAALARSGVGRLRLVDFDQVSLSSLNRHAVATLADVGSPKVVVLQRRLAAVAPWVGFELRRGKFDEGSAEGLLGPSGDGKGVDFVVDAIDNIDTKVELLRYCHANGLPVISAMGAGTKSDPTRVLVGDISSTTEDGLSKACRRRLKLLGITNGIPVVFSTEKAGEGKAELLPLPEEVFQMGKEAVKELGALQDFRVRILPVLGTMPAVFGYTAANHVILNIAGYPYDYVPAKSRDKTYDQILAGLQSTEEKIARAKHIQYQNIAIGLKLPLTPGDVSFLLEDVYKGRSAITGVPTRLVLARWKAPDYDTVLLIGEGKDEQKSAKLKLSDIVCMTKDEEMRHRKEVILGGKDPKDLYDEDVVKRVEARLQEAREAEKYR